MLEGREKYFKNVAFVYADSIVFRLRKFLMMMMISRTQHRDGGSRLSSEHLIRNSTHIGPPSLSH